MRHKQVKKVRDISFEEMINLRRTGVPLRVIGERLGISRQRVHQILGNTSNILPRKIKLTPEQKREVRKERTIKKFWSMVDVRDDDTVCWDWKGAINDITGYGRFGFMGKQNYAHRVAYTLSVGNIPRGLCVLHTCDNPKCCNPKHLRRGSQADNVNDRESRNRGKGRCHSQDYYNDRNKNIIKKYKTTRDAKIIADEHNISPAMIYRIVQNHRHNTRDKRDS